MQSPFRLASLLQVRRRERDDLAVQLAELRTQLQQNAAREREIDTERQDLHRLRKSNTTRVVSAHELKSCADFDRALLHAAQQLASQRHSLEAQLENMQLRLVAAQQEVARLEKLQQVAESKHRANLQRIQQRADDEWVTARYAKSSVRAWQ